jgi:hypothetical protein
MSSDLTCGRGPGGRLTRGAAGIQGPARIYIYIYIYIYTSRGSLLRAWVPIKWVRLLGSLQTGSPVGRPSRLRAEYLGQVSKQMVGLMYSRATASATP